MIGAAIAGTQLALGIGKSIAGAIKNKRARKLPGAVTAAETAVKEAALAKNVTQGAGMAQAQAQARQQQADTLGAAQLTTDDPNKLTALASQTNIQGLQSAQARDAITEQQRLQGQRDYISSLGNLGQVQEQRRTQEVDRTQALGQEGANLMGAGAQNLLTMQRDKTMMGIYDQIQKGTYDPTAKRDFSWKTLFDY